MYIIEATNVNDAFRIGLNVIDKFSIREDSRNGAVKVCPWPVMTIMRNPQERVLFNETRDANPFFHLFEAIWMLSGSNKVDFPATFVRRMKEYSDDGKTLNGAYGHRWRRYFEGDQLRFIIDELTWIPDSRRAVLSMWSPDDLMKESKDKPCNTHIYFRVNDGYLDMTVCNRSNDIVWGLYGANTVHLTILHEFIALALHRPIGRYYHLSNNFHLYPNSVPYRELLASTDLNLYNVNLDNRVYPMSILKFPEKWTEFLDDCERFVNRPGGWGSMPYDTEFFNECVVPMFNLWSNRDLEEAKNVSAEDWREAGIRWVERRQASSQ